MTFHVDRSGNRFQLLMGKLPSSVGQTRFGLDTEGPVLSYINLQVWSWVLRNAMIAVPDEQLLTTRGHQKPTFSDFSPNGPKTKTSTHNLLSEYINKMNVALKVSQKQHFKFGGFFFTSLNRINIKKCVPIFLCL